MSAEVNVLSPHWREVLTHAVAFTGAVVLLRRFAWKPILNLLDERRARIESDFDSIDHGRAANAQVREELEGQLRGIEQQARVKIQEGVSEGRKVAGEIKENARQEALELVQRAREDVDREKDKAEVALKEDMVEMAMAAAEKVIRAKLDDATHRRLISEAIEEMTRLKTQ